jgi:hypothetical protein
VTLADPVTCRPLGRPTLTVAFDVNTRMVLGFHLSLEPPSLLTVALCLAHAVMEKSHWLAARGVNTDWPAQGVPKAIYVDNGAKFHARAFERACSEYQICPVYGADLQDATGATLPEMLGDKRMAALAPHASAGIAVLHAWARGAGQGNLDAPEMLAILTVRHRRASPPSVAEQPRMSLQTRRDYHKFLTTPIIRQALTVVVPEYDEVAPVLAKPVRPCLHSLAQSSFLQGFTLAIGIGRIVDDPVARAIDLLLASATDWQGRVRDALSLWTLSLRRCISARLWRVQRDERARQAAEKAARKSHSHKCRRVQSHHYRYKIP